MAVSRRLRYEILRRDNHACRYCGAAAPDAKLTIDHVVPVALGGSDEPTNLVTACADCNGGKTSVVPDAPLVADVAADAMRWSAALQASANRMLADMKRRQEARDIFDELWGNWTCGTEKTLVPRPAGWRESVDQFIAAGLPLPILLECAQKAMNNQRIGAADTFRYMCGIAWKRVTEIQDTARAHLAVTDAEEDEYPDQSIALQALDLLSSAERQLYLDRALQTSTNPDEELFESALTIALVQIQEDRRDLAKVLRALVITLPDDHPTDWIAPDGFDLAVVDIVHRALPARDGQEVSAP